RRAPRLAGVRPGAVLVSLSLRRRRDHRELSESCLVAVLAAGARLWSVLGQPALDVALAGGWLRGRTPLGAGDRGRPVGRLVRRVRSRRQRCSAGAYGDRSLRRRPVSVSALVAA